MEPPAAACRGHPPREWPAARAQPGAGRPNRYHHGVVEKIEVVTKGDVRRAKLYYLRDRIGKAAKVKEKRVN